jgi:hypothetical protein
MVWPCRLGIGGRGLARQGRSGWAGLGPVRRSTVGQGKTRQVWRGMDRYGKAGHRINTGETHETGT